MHSQDFIYNSLFLSALTSAAYVKGAANLPRQAEDACQEFTDKWTNITYYPGDAMYTDLNEDYFSASSWLDPACIVTPPDGHGMSGAIKILTETHTSFAIRGGGHMPIFNAANINATGVLLACTSMNQLKLSDDQSTIEIGTGNKWSQVYQFLAPYQLTVVGGRAGLVGVPGFLLGGGISFFSNEYGWASANVIQFDCILANGDIISATSDNDYSDLFWALRGGGNSFAIVTAVHLKTYSLPAVAIGEVAYGDDVAAEFLDSIYTFANYGSADFKSGIEPRVQWIPSIGDPMYYGILFYNGDEDHPAALTNFTGGGALGPISSTFIVRPSMYNWTQEADAQRERLRGLRARFSVLSIKADRQALQILHDTFLDMMQAQLGSVTNFVGSLAFVPVTENYITVSTKNGGDPMDVDPDQAPYIFVEESLLWSDAADDEKITTFLSAFLTNGTSQLNDLGNVSSSYLYLNYADQTQRVFEGYPEESVKRLKSIRAQYDPEEVFTELMPGGWKVERVSTGQDEA